MTIITLHHLFFWSLCEFVGDCLGLQYFSSGAMLPQKNTLVQNNHLRFHTMTSKKDGTQLLLSKSKHSLISGSGAHRHTKCFWCIENEEYENVDCSQWAHGSPLQWETTLLHRPIFTKFFTPAEPLFPTTKQIILPVAITRENRAFILGHHSSQIGSSHSLLKWSDPLLHA